jgi:hypothetical protein
MFSVWSVVRLVCCQVGLLSGWSVVGLVSCQADLFFRLLLTG